MTLFRFSDWHGCPLNSSAELDACVPFLTTPLSTDIKKWRHAAFDASNGFVYFCDISGKSEGAMDCFCSSDGLTWNGEKYKGLYTQLGLIGRQLKVQIIKRSVSVLGEVL